MKSFNFFFLSFAFLVSVLHPLMLSSQVKDISQIKVETDRIQMILDDMRLKHEGIPAGVPSNWDWYAMPVIHNGNDSKGCKAFTAWGHIYSDTLGNKARNIRIQIRNIHSFYFDKKDYCWHQLQSTYQVQGKFCELNYSREYEKPDHIFLNKDQTLSIRPIESLNFHFWTSPDVGENDRAAIDPELVLGYFTSVEARIIIDDPDMPEEIANARFILGMGADYWPDLYATGNNLSVGVGRFKYILPEWRTFTFHTFGKNDDFIRLYPPPL